MPSTIAIQSLLIAVPAVRSVFCVRCACIIHNCARHIGSHVESCWRESDSRAIQAAIEEVSKTIGLDKEEEQNVGFQWLTDRRPAESIEAIDFLSVESDALGCPHCSYAVKDAKCLREHARKQHGSVPEKQRLPYLKGVDVQAITTENGGTRQYWRVHGAERATFRAEPIRNFLLRMEEEAQASLPARVLKAREESLEPNPFVDRLLFRRHLDGVSLRALGAASLKHVREGCPRLAGLFREMVSLVVSASADLHSNGGGVLRKEINRRKALQNPTTFLEPLSDSSLRGKYINTWKCVFSYMETLLRWDEDADGKGSQPPCTLTPRQAKALRSCFDLHEVEHAVERQRRVIELFNSVLQAHLFRDDFESPLVSALAAMAFDTEKMHWHTASSYPSHISHAIRVSLYVIYADAIMIPLSRGTEDQLAPCEGDDTTGACVRCGRSTISPEPSPESACGGACQPSDQERVRALRSKMSSVVYVNPEKDQHRTALVWAIDAQGLARQVRGEATPEPNIEWRDGGATLVRQGVRIPIHLLQAMVGSILSDAEKQMSLALLEAEEDRGRWLDQRIIPDPDAIIDNISCTTEGWSFLEHQDNEEWVREARFSIPNRIESNRSLYAAWRLNDKVFSGQRIKEWRAIVDSLQELILLMFYVLSVGPPRRTELTSLRVINSEGGLRNIVVYRGLVAVRTDYWKGYYRQKRARTVWRFLPRRASVLFLTYVAAVRSFNIDLERCSRNVGRPQPYLFSRNSPLEAAAGQNPALIDVNRLTLLLTQYTERHLGQAVGVMDFRHVLIALGRRFISKDLQSQAPALLEKSPDGDNGVAEDEPAASDAFEEMAAHAPSTGRRHYAVLSGPDETAWMDICFNIAAQGHICIMPQDQISSLKRTRADSFDAGAGDGVGDDFEGEHPEGSAAAALENIQHGLQLRRVRELPARLLDENRLRIMMRRGDARLRRHQKDVLELMSSGKADKIVYVAGTGGGKSIIYMLPAFVQPESMTVVVQPLRALQLDTAQRLADAGISNAIWRADASDADRPQTASVLLVTPEAMESREWAAFAHSCRRRHLVDRVIVDEVQETISAGRSYRDSLLRVVENINQLSHRQVLISGTLPPPLEPMLFGDLGLNWREWKVMRTRTSRLNIRYEHRAVEDPAEVTAFLQERVAPSLSHRPGQARPRRGIVYVYSTSLAAELGRSLACPHYSSKISEVEKAQALQLWEESGGLIVATGALGLGVDFKDVEVVVVVIHRHSVVDRREDSLPLLGMLQAFGRGGRDGSPCTGILLSSADVRNPDLRAYARAGCRRQAVSAYLDLCDEVCGFDSNPCDRCAPRGESTETAGRPSKRSRVELDESDSEADAAARPPQTAGQPETPQVPSSSLSRAAASPCNLSSAASTEATAVADSVQPSSPSPPSSLASSGTRAWSSTPSRDTPCQGRVPRAAHGSATPLRPGWELASSIVSDPDSQPFQARPTQAGASSYCSRLNSLLVGLEGQSLCPWCFLQGRSQSHSLRCCPGGGSEYASMIADIREEAYGKVDCKPIGSYSCCFSCLRPQIYCAKYVWDQSRDGCLRARPEEKCESGKRFQELAVILIRTQMEALERTVRRLYAGRRGGSWASENEAQGRLLGLTSSKSDIGSWLRQRVRVPQMRGLQAHNLFIVVGSTLESIGKLTQLP